VLPEIKDLLPSTPGQACRASGVFTKSGGAAGRVHGARCGEFGRCPGGWLDLRARVGKKAGRDGVSLPCAVAWAGESARSVGDAGVEMPEGESIQDEDSKVKLESDICFPAHGQITQSQAALEPSIDALARGASFV